MRKPIIAAIIIMLLIYPAFADENIYTWTDKDGINHFSNQSPPDNVQKYKTITIKPDESIPAGSAEETRPGYDSMVENARNEIQQSEIETKQKEIESNIKEKQKAEEGKNAQIEAKRKELQDKIDDLNKRPLSRTFDKAFRGAQIDMIQKQIDELDKAK